MKWRQILEPVSYQEFRQVDAWFLASIACVLTLGIVMVSSASIFLSETNYGHPFYFMTRQLIYLGLGLVFGYFMMSLPTMTLHRWGVWLMLFSLVLLSKGIDVEWIGSAGGMEERLVPEQDIALHTLSIKGIRGKGLF